MKQSNLIIIFLCLFSTTYGQFEISTGYAVNKRDADGIPIHLAYDIKIWNRLFTKSQIGFKHLSHYNDYVGATIKNSTWEIHQTISYEIVKKKKYILKPNIGVNYRFYHWKGKIDGPYNEPPQRVYRIGMRKGSLLLNTYDGQQEDTYKDNNVGFSIQIQNQFKLTHKLWLQITPFMEPDYDGIHNTGGCYIGVIFKQL